MKNVWIAIYLAFCTFAAASAKDYEAILQKVAESDQQVRRELISAQKSGNMELLADAAKRMERCDKQNQKIVFKMLDKRGVPENLSNEAFNSIWLVVQHSDTEHIEKYLPILRQAADRGGISQIELTTMEDRLRVYKRTAQIYGSQTIDTGNTIYFYPIAELENLDSRRAEIGMSPIAEYFEILKEVTGKNVIFDPTITFEKLDELRAKNK